MFENMKTRHKGHASSKPSRSNAGPTPFHRSSSYLPLDPKRGLREERFKWLIYDNNGSFNGWFDWLPLWMRVGYWNPIVVVVIASFYVAIFWFKPRPLEFSPFVLDKILEDEVGMSDAEKIDHAMMRAMGIRMPRATVMDALILTWGIIVMTHAKITLGSIGAFPMSFTGWSWMLLTSRAGLEFAAWAATSQKYHRIATSLATAGSSIRLVAVTNACVVCTVWNFVLLPIIYFKSVPPGEKRRNFLKFNFGFFMTNIHILNFPLAVVNILRGNRVRLFTMSDLWVAYFIVVLYSILYFFVMDRLGLHFYPIFNPRTVFSIVSIVAVLGLYYFLFLEWNKYISLHHDV